MTKPRRAVEAELAAVGWPALWANDERAAALSGMTLDAFKAKLPALEKLGFPRVNPLNGKRAIPAILAFWRLPVAQPVARAGESREADGVEVENWDA